MLYNKTVGTGICCIDYTHYVHKVVSRRAQDNLLQIDDLAMGNCVSLKDKNSFFISKQLILSFIHDFRELVMIKRDLSRKPNYLPIILFNFNRHYAVSLLNKIIQK